MHADNPDHIAYIWRCHWEQSNFHRQIQTRRPDGKLADFQVWYEYVAPDKVLDYWLDVSEKCRAKRVLEENLALSRTILDSLLEKIVVVDRSGMILDVNQPWRTAMVAVDIESYGLGMNYFDLRVKFLEQISIRRAKLPREFMLFCAEIESKFVWSTTHPKTAGLHCRRLR